MNTTKTPKNTTSSKGAKKPATPKSKGAKKPATATRKNDKITRIAGILVANGIDYFVGGPYVICRICRYQIDKAGQATQCYSLYINGCDARTVLSEFDSRYRSGWHGFPFGYYPCLYFL